MGIKVNVINEIYSRLNTAISGGGALVGVKRIRIGSVEEMRKENDFPIINIQLLSGREEANLPNRQARDEMRIEILLVHKKLAETNNVLGSLEDAQAGKNIKHNRQKYSRQRRQHAQFNG